MAPFQGAFPGEGACDWTGFYNLFHNDKGLKLKMNIPETVLLRDGLVSAIFTTNKAGYIVRRPVHATGIDSIKRRMLAALEDDRINTSRYVTIERRPGKAPKLLKRAPLNDVLQSLSDWEKGAAPEEEWSDDEDSFYSPMHSPHRAPHTPAPQPSTGKKSQGGGRLEPEKPLASGSTDAALFLMGGGGGWATPPNERAPTFKPPHALQAYIQPNTDQRYVCSYVHGGEFAEIRTFPRRFSRRYSGKGDAADIDYRREPPSAPGVPGDVEVNLRSTFRQLIVAMIHYIHKAHGLILSGLVVEFIRDLTGTVYLLGVLKTEWAASPQAAVSILPAANIRSEWQDEPLVGPGAGGVLALRPASAAAPEALPTTPHTRGFSTFTERVAGLMEERSGGLKHLARGQERRPSSVAVAQASPLYAQASEPNFSPATWASRPHTAGGGGYGYGRPDLCAQLLAELEATKDELCFQAELAESAVAQVAELEKKRAGEAAAWAEERQALVDSVERLTAELENAKMEIRPLREHIEEARKSGSTAAGEVQHLRSRLEEERGTILAELRDHRAAKGQWAARERADAAALEEALARRAEAEAEAIAMAEEMAEARQELEDLRLAGAGAGEPESVALDAAAGLMAAEKDPRAARESLARLLRAMQPRLRAVYLHYSLEGPLALKQWPPRLELPQFLSMLEDCRLLKPGGGGGLRDKYVKIFAKHAISGGGVAGGAAGGGEPERPSFLGSAAAPKVLCAYDGFLAAVLYTSHLAGGAGGSTGGLGGRLVWFMEGPLKDAQGVVPGARAGAGEGAGAAGGGSSESMRPSTSAGDAGGGGARKKKLASKKTKKTKTPSPAASRPSSGRPPSAPREQPMDTLAQLRLQQRGLHASSSFTLGLGPGPGPGAGAGGGGLGVRSSQTFTMGTGPGAGAGARAGVGVLGGVAEESSRRPSLPVVPLR